MNTPLDAHPKDYLVEEAESQSLQEEKSTNWPTPAQSNCLPDESEVVSKQTVENFKVPSLEALLVPSVDEPEQIEKAEPELLKAVLIVDDLPVNRKLIGSALKKIGYTFDQAENGQVALEMVKQKQYAIVFMDLEMPVMSGFKAAIAIRQWDIENRQHTIIVGMSSSKKQVELQRCVMSGMDDYLSKGSSAKQIRELVARYPIKKQQIEEPVPSVQENKDGVLIDLELVQEAHGTYEAEGVVDIAIGSMKTVLGCLRCGIDDKDLRSIKHFAKEMTKPCTLLGLRSMKRLTERIASDAENELWNQALERMKLLEAQYSQILEQLTGVSERHHRVE